MVFLNAVMSLVCTLCASMGLWPLRGLMHAWLFKRHPYTWTTHVMYGWFAVGVLGVFVTNTFAFFNVIKTETTRADEAYRMVLFMNAVMYGAWGAHNLQIALRILGGTDRGNLDEWRRPVVMLMVSLVGACGSTFVRNVYAFVDETSTSDAVTRGTWAWEWLSIAIMLSDLGYFICTEHTLGMAMKKKK